MVTKLEKPLAWIGSSKKDLMALPIEVRKFFGHALDFAQHGEQHNATKVLKGFGGAGVLEVLEDDQGGTYRAVYTVKFKEAVFVLHVFQKKRAVLPHRSQTWSLSMNG
jgi:phage-related protein